MQKPTQVAEALSRAAAMVRDKLWDAATEYGNLEVALGDLKVRDQKTFSQEMATEMRILKHTFKLAAKARIRAIELVEKAMELKKHGQ